MPHTIRYRNADSEPKRRDAVVTQTEANLLALGAWVEIPVGPHVFDAQEGDRIRLNGKPYRMINVTRSTTEENQLDVTFDLLPE